jgi:hypothetical protein
MKNALIFSLSCLVGLGSFSGAQAAGQVTFRDAAPFMVGLATYSIASLTGGETVSRGRAVAEMTTAVAVGLGSHFVPYQVIGDWATTKTTEARAALGRFCRATGRFLKGSLMLPADASTGRILIATATGAIAGSLVYSLMPDGASALKMAPVLTLYVAAGFTLANSAWHGALAAAGYTVNVVETAPVAGA